MTWEITYTYRHLNHVFTVEAETESDARKIAKTRVAATINTITPIGEQA